MLYDKNVMMPAENYLTRSSWGLLLKPSLLANSNIPISHRCLGTYCSISILQEIDLLLLGVESTNLGWPIWPLRCERPNFGGYQHTWCTRIFPNSTRPIEGLKNKEMVHDILQSEWHLLKPGGLDVETNRDFVETLSRQSRPVFKSVEIESLDRDLDKNRDFRA